MSDQTNQTFIVKNKALYGVISTQEGKGNHLFLMPLTECGGELRNHKNNVSISYGYVHKGAKIIGSLEGQNKPPKRMEAKVCGYVMGKVGGVHFKYGLRLLKLN